MMKQLKLQKKTFDSLKNRKQNNLEAMRGSEIVFNYVHLLYYKCHKINSNCGWSYINYPCWIKDKKAATNPFNNKCFQCASTVALNHEEIKEGSQRIRKIRPIYE